MSIGAKRKFSLAQLAVIARLFGALSEPNRLVLLQGLFGGPRTVSQLMEACSMKQANVSKHLGVLHNHRLVKRKRVGSFVYYEIADPMVLALCNLVCGKLESDAKCAAALFAPDI